MWQDSCQILAAQYGHSYALLGKSLIFNYIITSKCTFPVAKYTYAMHGRSRDMTPKFLMPICAQLLDT